MVVSGLLVSTVPDKLQDVKGKLLKIKGIEVSSVLEDCRIVVVVESKNIEDEAAVSKVISKLDGVLGINIAYHHFGDGDQA